VTDHAIRVQEGGFRAAFLFLRLLPISQALAYLAFWLLLVASFSMPNHYPPWAAAQQDMVAAGAGVVALWAAVRWAGPLAWPPAALFFAALAALPLLQFAAGQVWFFGDAWIASLYLGAGALAVASGQALQRRWPRHFALALASALLAAALLGCVLALAQRFSVDWGPLALFLIDVRPGHAPFANLAQPNQFATLLVLGLGALLFLHERAQLRGAAAAIAAALLVVCLALTQSRAGLLLMLVTAAWLLVYRRRFALRTPRRAIVALLALWGLAYLLWPLTTTLAEVGRMASVASRMEVGPRTIIWSQLFEAALREPWLGYGWNQVSVAQMAVAADFGWTRFTEHSHNLLLDLMLWCGIPLTLLIVVVAAAWALKRARAVRSLEGGFALLIAALLMTHSAVEFPLDYLYFMLPFGWALGLLEQDYGARARAPLGKTGGSVLAALVAVLALVASVDYLRFEEAWRDLRYTVARIGKSQIAPGDVAPQTEFTQLRAFYQYALIEPRAGLAPAEREWMRRVTTRFPYVPALYRLAVVQALHGEPDAARLTFERLRRLHGDEHYQTARRDLAELAAQGHPELALQLP